jgi:hypothetical protein
MPGRGVKAFGQEYAVLYLRRRRITTTNFVISLGYDRGERCTSLLPLFELTSTQSERRRVTLSKNTTFDKYLPSRTVHNSQHSVVDPNDRSSRRSALRLSTFSSCQQYATGDALLVFQGQLSMSEKPQGPDAVQRSSKVPRELPRTKMSTRSYHLRSCP